MQRVAPSVLGVLVAAAAWVFLVLAAISFGHAAMAADTGSAWAIAVAATLGAAGCLVLVLLLLGRLRDLSVRRRGAWRARPTGGRHRR